METTEALNKAATAMYEAVAAYVEARYANYRERLVSREAAVHHAVDDARTMTDAAVDHGSMELQRKIVDGTVR